MSLLKEAQPVFSDASEVLTPYMKEDFEPGDRVWYKYSGEVRKGTVLGVYERYVTMEPDDKFAQAVSLYYNFSRGYAKELWGRIPDLKQLEAGTKLSYLRTDGNREHGVIISFLPDVEIVFQRLRPSSGKFWFSTRKGMDLELQMMNWGIEG